MIVFNPQSYSSWKSGQNQSLICWGHWWYWFPLAFLLFPSSPLLFYPGYSEILFYPSEKTICIKTCLSCRYKAAYKEAEYLISFMFWANDLYFSHSCEIVSIARTVGTNELEKSFIQGENHHPGITSIFKAWSSKIWRWLAESSVVHVNMKPTLISLSDHRNLPSTEYQAEMELWNLC